MQEKKFTVEELVLDEGFIDYCLHEDSAYRPYWEHIIELNAGQSSVFEKAVSNVLLLSGGLSEKEIRLQFEKVKSKLQTGKKIIADVDEINTIREYKQPESADNSKRVFRKKNFLYVAAIVTAFCVGAYTLLPLLTKQKAPASAETVYSSRFGERKKIELPDGSVILLNANSQVRLKNDFNNTAREVELTGEAFFNVAKDPSKPFIVKSNNLTTTALGTSFYVYAQHANEKYSVDLLEGKVKVSGKEKNNMMLVAGEEANWNKANGHFTKTNFNTAELQQWLTGKISLEKTQLDSAIRILDKWYAVDIEIKNKNLARKTLSGEYDNLPLDNVLKVICFSLSCKYTYINNTVIIE